VRLVGFIVNKGHAICLLSLFVILTYLFGPERDEVTGEWRRLHKEELYGLSSLNIIWVIKSERISCGVGGIHMARMEERCT
jgi:hypothetical protein